MVEEAIIDAYGESEQRTAFYTVLDQHEQIIAICRRGRSLQAIPILELPLPTPRPAGVEWVEAYRCWAAGG